MFSLASALAIPRSCDVLLRGCLPNDGAIGSLTLDENMENGRLSGSFRVLVSPSLFDSFINDLNLPIIRGAILLFLSLKKYKI